LSRSRRDSVLNWTLLCSGSLAGLIVLLIVAFLLIESAPALWRVGAARFFTDASWHPNPVSSRGTFNMLPMIWGTLLAAAGGFILAAPLGILCGVFCRFYASRTLAHVFRRLIELLAGIPSVVYGLWGLVVLVPLIRRLAPPGPSLLAGALILAIMILPTVALTAEAALTAVSHEHLRAAAALGLSRAATVRSVALPAAWPGILTGLLLAIGRAVGETMAILMVCGNVVQTPDSLFAPVRTLTANIALEMAYAMDDHRSALFVSGLMLTAIIVALVALAARFSPERADA